MKEIKIKLDYSHGPIWKEKFDAATGNWSTGIPVIDNDVTLQALNDEAESIYTSLYTFDNGRCVFDEESYEAQKPELISLIQAIIARLDELNDGSYYTMECEYEKQVLSG